MPLPAAKANPNWPAAKKGPKGLKQSDVKEGDEKEVDGEEELEKSGGGEEDGGGGGEGDKVAKVEVLEAKLAELKAKKQQMEAEERALEAAIENQKIQETLEFLEKQCGEDLQWQQDLQQQEEQEAQQKEQQEAQQKQWQLDLQEAKRRKKERASVEEVKEELEAERAGWQKVLQSYKEAHKTRQESHQQAQLQQLKLAAAAASGKVQKAEGSKCKDDDSGASGDTE